MIGPYAASMIEYESNVFARSSAEPSASQEAAPVVADSLFKELVGIDVRWPISSQVLRTGLELRRLDYVDLQQLDHNEYRFSAGMDWAAHRIVEGAVDYQRERRMAAFEHRTSSELSIETEQLGDAEARLNISPTWTAEATLRVRQLESPLPDYSDYALKENTAGAHISYMSRQTLLAGLKLEYLSGSFDGVPDAGKFDQQTVELTSEYTVSGLSRILVNLGYTQRQQDPAPDDKVTAVTGLLGYRRTLTGKTSASLDAFRRIRSYVGGADSVKETGASLSWVWTPTLRTSITGTYQWTHEEFRNAAADLQQDGRNDDTQLASLKLKYQMGSWLSISPYLSYQARNSDVDVDRYHASIVGLQLLARFD